MARTTLSNIFEREDALKSFVLLYSINEGILEEFYENIKRRERWDVFLKKFVGTTVRGKRVKKKKVIVISPEFKDLELRN